MLVLHSTIPLWFSGAPSPPDFRQCARRQDHRNGSAVLYDFNAAQHGDVVKEAAEVVLRMTSRYLLHI